MTYLKQLHTPLKGSDAENLSSYKQHLGLLGVVVRLLNFVLGAFVLYMLFNENIFADVPSLSMPFVLLHIFVGLLVYACVRMAYELAVMVKIYISNSPTIEARPDGLTLRQTKTEHISWDDVRLVQVRTKPGHSTLFTKRIDIYLTDDSPSAQKGFKLPWSTPCQSIGSEWFKGNNDEVAQTLMDFRAKYNERIAR